MGVQEAPKAHNRAASDSGEVCASYCAKDAQAAVPVLKGLRDAGFRVWSSSEGEELSGADAERLSGSGAFVALASAAYFDSHRCRSEFNMAMQRDVPFVAVLLDDFPAMPALRMQLASVQALRAFEYESIEDLLHEIVAALDADCRPSRSSRERGAAARDDSAFARAPKRDVSSDRKLPREDREVGSHGKRGYRTALIAACVAIVLVAAFFGVSGGVLPGQTPTAQPGMQVLSVAKPAIPADSLVDCMVFAQEDSSIEGFQQAVEIMKGRLDTYVGEGKYDMTLKGDSILLVLPEERLCGESLRDVLLAYIIRPMELAFYPSGEKGAKSSAIALSRADIESVTIEGFPADAPVLPEAVKENANDYPSVLKLVLCPSYLEEHAQTLRAWGSALALGQDVEYPNTYGCKAALSDDGTAVYLFVEKPRPEDLQLLAHCYTHEPLPIHLTYLENAVMRADWEQVKDNGSAGKNQVDRSKLKGKVITLRYGAGDWMNPLTEGAIVDWQDAMKERLDALGVPYALGMCKQESDYGVSETCLVAALPNRFFEKYEWWVLGYGNRLKLWFVNGRNSMYLDYSVPDAMSVEETDGIVRLKVDSVKMGGLDDAGSFERLMDATAPGDEIWIVVEGGINLCSAIYEGEQDGVYAFTDIMTPNGAHVEDEEGAWVKAVLSTYLHTAKRIPGDEVFEDYQLTDGGKLVLDQGTDVASDPMDTEMLRRIREIAPDADVGYHAATIEVYLYLPIDDNLAVDSLDIARRLYESIAFYSPARIMMSVYFVGSDDESAERAQMDMWWGNSDTTTIEPEIRFKCKVSGGRVASYASDFSEILKTDEFWSSQNVSFETGADE